MVQASEVTFRHNGERIEALLSNDGSNGSLLLDRPNINNAGIWTCNIRTRSQGTATGDISVFLRPVLLTNTTIKLEDKTKIDKGQDQLKWRYQFEASGITVVKGEDARLDCPIFGFPRPQISWTKNGKSIEPPRMSIQSGGILLVRNVTATDDGIYTCSGKNSFVYKGQSTNFHITVERRLRVKSELAWLIPLSIIVVCLILLVVIIAGCEFRKRRNEQKLLEVEEE